MSNALHKQITKADSKHMPFQPSPRLSGERVSVRHSSEWQDGRERGKGEIVREGISRARQLRRTPTAAEHQAWWLLRNRKLSGFKFRRQHSIGPFCADFCCPELKLIVELEGSVHSQPSVLRADSRRDRYLQEKGYQVVHIPNAIVLDAPEMFVKKIEEICQERKRQLESQKTS